MFSVRKIGDNYVPNLRIRQGISSLNSSNTDRFSIIIVTFNEALLYKTVQSVLDNTDPGYLQEIIIIDDCSTVPVSIPPNLSSLIRVFRPTKNLGLIKARIWGGNLAVGKYLAFIDAHVHVSKYWLKTPSALLNENNRTVVNFINFILDDKTFSSKALSGGFGSSAGITWDLHQFWGGGSENSLESPITMGMFAITKYWWSQGMMDEGLVRWGGENVDISLRTWLCGGRIMVAKDSYVAHLFRSSFPYPVNTKDIQRNYIRVAKVWLGEPYIRTFYKEANIPLNKEGEPLYNYGNITDRLHLKEQLHCQPFSYYLDKFKNRSPCTKQERTKGCGGIQAVTSTMLVTQKAKEIIGLSV
ncbi:hypothetical protein WA158_000343 [Blastocystis sp. Blastoise]